MNREGKMMPQRFFVNDDDTLLRPTSKQRASRQERAFACSSLTARELQPPLLSLFSVISTSDLAERSTVGICFFWDCERFFQNKRRATRGISPVFFFSRSLASMVHRRALALCSLAFCLLLLSIHGTKYCRVSSARYVKCASEQEGRWPREAFFSRQKKKKKKATASSPLTACRRRLVPMAPAFRYVMACNRQSIAGSR